MGKKYSHTECCVPDGQNLVLHEGLAQDLSTVSSWRSCYRCRPLVVYTLHGRDMRVTSLGPNMEPELMSRTMPVVEAL